MKSAIWTILVCAAFGALFGIAGGVALAADEIWTQSETVSVDADGLRAGDWEAATEA
jgi:hypothetical protein